MFSLFLIISAIRSSIALRWVSLLLGEGGGLGGGEGGASGGG